MNEGDLVRLLEARHYARLTWEDYEDGVTADGNRVPCWFQCHATVHDAVNYHRKPGRPNDTDAEILADFIAKYGASEIAPNTKPSHPPRGSASAPSLSADEQTQGDK